MGIKDNIIAALITFPITVGSSLAVYYLTDKKPEIKGEHLIYSVQNTPTISDNGKISFLEISIKNDGEEISKEINSYIEIPNNATIIKHSVKFNTKENKDSYSYQEKEGSVIVDKDYLLPNEEEYISILFDGSDYYLGSINVRSKNVVATRVGLHAPKKTIYSYSNKITILLILLFSLIAQILLSRFVKKNINSFLGRDSRINNAAFVFLQMNLLADAGKIFSSSISQIGADPIFLANYGLWRGLNNDTKSAEKIFAVSEWWSNSNHELSIVKYNKSILNLNSKNYDDAGKYLKESLELNKKTIIKYCKINYFIVDAYKNNVNINKIINSFDKNFAPKTPDFEIR